MFEQPTSAAIERAFRRSLRTWTLIVVVSMTALGLSFWLTQPPADNSEVIDFLNRFRGGTLIIAGGGSLPPEIRTRFLDFAGGPKYARLVVIPAYDLDAEQSASLVQIWRNMGAQSIQVLHATSRAEAERPQFAQPLTQATGVWLTGGRQDWLSEHYAGTLVESELRALIERGGVVGGTSAGAAAMTKIMIEQGMEDAVEGTGFDLFPNAVIDQHFLRRSRLNRLMGLMESHSELVAFGIDEGTALVVQVQKGRVGVIGSSYVVAYVPRTDGGEPRFESMKRCDHIDLAGLKSGRMRVSSASDLDAALGDQ